MTIDIHTIVEKMNVYFDNHMSNVTYKTMANRVGITHKQSRYILRTHFDMYETKSNKSKGNRKKKYYVRQQ